MKWRLALDMGTNSLGWVAFRLDGSDRVDELMDAGVRIFPDGREPAAKGRVGESLAVERRLARGARRNRDRRMRRKQGLVRRLVALGLMPQDKQARKELENLDPYQLRADAVERELEPHELGRVLFHMGQRRGFLSNRKSDGDDEETGKIKPKITELKGELDRKGWTLGQWLNDRLKSGKSIRFRGEDGDYYPDRAMYRDEFDRIREKQKGFHTNISDKDWDDLRNGNREQGFDGIFFQRKLKPVEKGRCEFFADEYRAHKDLPVAHEFRILQEVSNLRYYDDTDEFDLTPEQRQGILQALDSHKTLSFNGLRKLRGADGTSLFPRGCLFNLEKGPRDKLNGNATAIEMRKPGMLGPRWDALSPDHQNDMVEMLHDAEDDATLVRDLQQRFGLTEDRAKAVSGFKLSAATTHLSRKFMVLCARIMREQGLGYHEAVGEICDDNGELLHHSHRPVDELLDRLPYYGEVLRGSVIGGKPDRFEAGANPEQHYGKINNPTVHVALNQMRKLLNCLVERFGPPADIHVELVRDLKKTARARNDIAGENAKYARENARRTDLFRDLHNGQEPTGLDLKKVRLW